MVGITSSTRNIGEYSALVGNLRQCGSTVYITEPLVSIFPKRFTEKLE